MTERLIELAGPSGLDLGLSAFGPIPVDDDTLFGTSQARGLGVISLPMTDWCASHWEPSMLSSPTMSRCELPETALVESRGQISFHDGGGILGGISVQEANSQVIMIPVAWEGWPP